MRRACEGAETLSTRHGMTEMEECLECGSACRWDLTEHSFFGFKAMCDKWKTTQQPEG